MMDARQLGTYFARGRVGLGLAAMVAPSAALLLTHGRGASTPAARAYTRLAGARDSVMGAGGSIAAGQHSGGGDWLSMMALVDAFDAVVMLVSPGLPKRARLIGLGAAASAILHLSLARDIEAEDRAQPL